MKPSAVRVASGIPAAIDPKITTRRFIVGASLLDDGGTFNTSADYQYAVASKHAPSGSWLKMHSRHLEGLRLEIKVWTGQRLTESEGMAIAHHELSVEKAVIPFSLRLPTSSSPAGPATFEMEHFQ
ncbi:hypothetical protein [Pseudomonas sp. ANT_H12B]|uniref:hypothetical protein n=1 Tax=Pseudomonas sp. ANT_H12B TaxID=2597348 RepID=UPI0011EE8B55|nr:hypothetical protein [Pseudomonas sp. ANT_H12B]KAA0978077.1 hypothetical protein FQ185_02985 [Pseudomonas sp. ANT_H12B]